MTVFHPQFLTNAEGEKLLVVLSMEEYNAILDELDMLEDIRLYDKVKAEGGPLIPAEEVYASIDEGRSE